MTRTVRFWPPALDLEPRLLTPSLISCQTSRFAPRTHRGPIGASSLIAELIASDGNVGFGAQRARTERRSTTPILFRVRECRSDRNLLLR